jgi:hypothetical protein
LATTKVDLAVVEVNAKAMKVELIMEVDLVAKKFDSGM